MHPNPRRILPVVLVLIALIALAYWFFVLRPQQSANGTLTASGTIEVTQVQVAPELGGKVIEVLKSEGDAVKAGDILVQLDTALLEAQRAQAEAALAVAKANSEAAESNVESAQSAVKAAEAAQTAAQAAVDAAQANLELLESGATPSQVAAARAQLAQAEANLQAAAASFAALTAGARPEEVDTARYRLELARQGYLTLTVVLSEEQIEKARTAATTAETNRKQAEARLESVQKESNPAGEALPAAQTAVLEAGEAQKAAQVCLEAVQDPAMPFYRQLEAAYQSWQAAKFYLANAQARQAALQSDPDMPDAVLEDARTTVDELDKLVVDAKAVYDALNNSRQGDRLRAAWDEYQTALTELNRLGRTGGVETALYQLDAASALRDFAGANLETVENGTRPEQISAAQAQLEAAQAQLEAAKTNLETAKIRVKTAQSQAEAAQAQVEVAQAAVDTVNVQIAKMTITAPADGVVLSRAIEPGEIAAPGATLLRLARTADMTITVYIPEDRYGEISLGQLAEVRVDSFPNDTFAAEVIYISDRAEFTPRNVQTVEGRKTTVFAIKLRLTDPGGKLKAGMPADVTFK